MTIRLFYVDSRKNGRADMMRPVVVIHNCFAETPKMLTQFLKLISLLLFFPLLKEFLLLYSELASCLYPLLENLFSSILTRFSLFYP